MQGKETVKALLKENDKLRDEPEQKVREHFNMAIKKEK